MSPSALLLFAATVLIWGSTWYAIKFQLGDVAPLVSVVYRFGLASLLLFAWCLLRGAPLRLPLAVHRLLVVQGLCMFGLNYWLVYLSEQYLTSGVVAVVFSSIVFMNIVNAWLLMRRPAEGPVVLGAVLGMLGVVLLFLPELQRVDLAGNALLGFGLALLGTLLASIGNVAVFRWGGHGLPVISVNAWGMLYGSLALAAIAVTSGTRFTFSPDPAYFWSLLYLAVFGSIVAFGCYLRLLAMIGPERAAYNAMLVPVVALLVSTVFEAYLWTPAALGGLLLIAIGNVLVLRWRQAAVAVGKPA